MNTGRESIKHLINNSRGRLDQHPRLPFGLELQFGKNRMKTLAALLLKVHGLPRGELAEIPDNLSPISQSVPANRVAYEGLKDLLSATTADSQCSFQSSAVDPR